MAGDVPVILEVGFENLVAIVELGLRAGLRERRHVADQQVCEGIAGTDGGIAGVKGQTCRWSPFPGAASSFFCAATK